MQLLALRSEFAPFRVDAPEGGRPVLLAPVFSQSQVQAQCIDYGDYVHRVDTFETSVYPTRVAVAGDRIYVSGDGGLYLIDITNPSSLQILGSVDTPGMARGVVVSGDVAYIAARTSGLHAVDITNPQTPQIIGSVDTP